MGASACCAGSAPAFTRRSPTADHDEVMDIGPGELIIVLGIVLVLLGPTQLPKLARSLGQAIGELRGASADTLDDGDDEAAGESSPVRADIARSVTPRAVVTAPGELGQRSTTTAG